MCYAIPGKLVEINKNIGIVDYFGEKRRVLIDFSNVKLGDYVYAQGGVLINKISEREALEILETWEEVFFELKKIDEKLAKVERIKSSKRILEILQKVNLNKELGRQDLLNLFIAKERQELKLLYDTANNIRQKQHGNACCVHGIIEFSNICKNSCHYCGIRKERKVRRYRMDIREIIKVAEFASKKLGFKALVLQSGEDDWYSENKLIAIVKEIKKMGVLVFLSLGQRDKTTYKRLYEAGARAVLLRFETSNREIFKRLKPDITLEERLELIRYLKSLGFILATGFLVGLPQENNEDIINNILLTHSFKPQMYSFGPFISTKATPLEAQPLVHKDTMLKTIAISRLLDKDSNILVTTALETLDKRTKKKGLLAGANSLMINVTPKEYKNLYCIYDNRIDNNKEIKESISETLDLLYSLGRAPTDLGI
jgi:biotin synthase